MVSPSGAAVVLVRFPFSDLSQTKLRPALVLADSGRGDWILCQITSNPYGDPRAVPLAEGDFQSGALRSPSYARPGKLFTASGELFVRQIGRLHGKAFSSVIDAVVALLRSSQAAAGV